MFTGIIEDLGIIQSKKATRDSITFKIRSAFASELIIGQSIAHNGVCLTVIEHTETCYKVTAVPETLDKSNLKYLKVGSLVNLERSLKIGDRLDGHLVQGHVDQTAICIKRPEENNLSGYFKFQIEGKSAFINVEKGSVAINGVSLTIAKITDKNTFEIAIIPHTYQQTNFKTIQMGDYVNIEYDMIGKYVSTLYHRGFHQ